MPLWTVTGICLFSRRWYSCQAAATARCGPKSWQTVQHKEIADEVGRTIGEENAVLLAKHGVLCCGRSLEEALLANQIVEKSALILLAAGRRERLIPIPEEFVESERHRFLYKYGTAEDAA